LEPRALLVLYDGECPFCRACARWVARRDRRNRLALEPYQETGDPRVTAQLRQACQSALHVIHPGGEVDRAGRAVVVVLASLGWPVGWLRHRPFAWLIEAGYWPIARNRGRLSRFVHA
jgi:predicted DCC family thiol-disulfide oxidoreductase YuxK